MLFGEELGWRHQCNLVPGFQGHQHCQRRDDRLSRTDVTLEQTCHRRAGTELSPDLFKHPLLGRGQGEGQELTNSLQIDNGRIDLWCLRSPACRLPRSHRAGEGEQLVKREPQVVPAAAVVQLFQGPLSGDHHPRARSVRAARAAHRLRAGSLESFAHRFGEGIDADLRGWQTLLDELPQTPPTESSKTWIHGYDARHLVTDLLDLRVDELERAPTRLPHLTVEIELGFASEPGVDPPVIEPYDLEVSATVINQPVDDHHSAPGYSAQSHPLDVSSQEHPGACLGR